MSNRVTKKVVAFEGVRLEVTTMAAFDDVIQRLRESMGKTSIPEIVEIAQRSISRVQAHH